MQVRVVFPIPTINFRIRIFSNKIRMEIGMHSHIMKILNFFDLLQTYPNKKILKYYDSLYLFTQIIYL